MNTEVIKETATLIHRVIMSSGSYRMSWAYHNPKAAEYRGMPALSARVSGYQHKGYLVVALNEGADLFEVYALSIKGEVKKEVKGVYIDQLIEVIDRMVEIGEMSQEQYEAKVRKTYGL
jgi:hypothetical protein